MLLHREYADILEDFVASNKGTYLPIYRGEGLDNGGLSKVREGVGIDFGGLSSWTLDTKVAKHFALEKSNKQPTILVLPDGTQKTATLPVEHNNYGEYEHITSSKFDGIVDRVSYRNGIAYVTVKEKNGR